MPPQISSKLSANYVNEIKRAPDLKKVTCIVANLKKNAPLGAGVTKSSIYTMLYTRLGQICNVAFRTTVQNYIMFETLASFYPLTHKIKKSLTEGYLFMMFFK